MSRAGVHLVCGLLTVVFIAVPALVSAQQDEDVLWEEEDPSAPLRDTLRALDPPLPCFVAATEVIPSFSGNTVKAVLATQGCSASVSRDTAGDAPTELATYVRIVDEARSFIAKEEIKEPKAVRVEFAANGWVLTVDLEAYKAASGSSADKVAAAATWEAVAEDVVVAAPPDLLQHKEELVGTKVLDKETIARTINQNMSAISFCQIKRRQDTGVNPVGEAKVRFSIDPQGTVSGVSVEDSSFEDPELEGCLVERFGNLSFPESSTEEAFEIAWPIKFD